MLISHFSSLCTKHSLVQCISRLLRVSEVAESIHAVKAKDVQIGANKNKFLIVLRTSKTHWKNMKPQLIKISATKCHGSGSFGWADAKLPCLYQLLRDYSAKREGYSCDEEPFFVFSEKSPLMTRHVTNCLKNALRDSGFNCNLYSNHSLRIGQTCDLYNLGLSVETIKKLGRWRSNAVYKYIRQ